MHKEWILVNDELLISCVRRLGWTELASLKPGAHEERKNFNASRRAASATRMDDGGLDLFLFSSLFLFLFLFLLYAWELACIPMGLESAYRGNEQKMDVSTRIGGRMGVWLCTDECKDNVREDRIGKDGASQSGSGVGLGFVLCGNSREWQGHSWEVGVVGLGFVAM